MNEQEKEYLFWLTTTTDKYRGIFMSRAISAELIIDEFLTWYFVENNEYKRIHFQQLVLSSIDMTFSQKIKMFTEIVSKFIPSEFSKYQEYLSKIEALRIKRNEFAHSKIDSRPQSITNNHQVRNKLHLIKLKDYQLRQTILEIDILEIQFNEFGQLVEDLANLLKKFIIYIQNETHPAKS